MKTGMNLRTVVEESAIYRGIESLLRWIDNSRTVSILGSPRVIQLLAAFALLGSSYRIFVANIHASLQFLSFLIVFLLTTILVWSFVEPVSE